MNTVISLVIFIVSFVMMHFVLGMVAWIAAVLAFIFAMCGIVIIAFVSDAGSSDSGSDWW